MATQSVVLNPGDCVVLPAGATITSLILNGSMTVTSSCNDLPEPTGYKCGVFYMNIDDDNNNNHPNDENSTIFTSIKFGDTTVTLGGLLENQSVAGLNVYLTGQTPIFEFKYINRYTIDDPGDNKRDAVFLYFQVAEELYDTLELKVTGNSGMILPTTQIYRPYAETTCGDYSEY